MTNFNIYHIFAPFVKLCGWRFLYFFNLCHVRNEAVFLILEYSSLRGVKQKKHQKKLWPLDPYYKRSDWKTWLSERSSEPLKSKLWKKIHAVEVYQNRVKLNQIHPPMDLSKIFSRSKSSWDSHVKFKGKNKVSHTRWAKLCSLIGQKWQNSFQ